MMAIKIFFDVDNERGGSILHFHKRFDTQSFLMEIYSDYEKDAQDIVSDVFYIATLKDKILYNHPNKIGTDDYVRTKCCVLMIDLAILQADPSSKSRK